MRKRLLIFMLFLITIYLNVYSKEDYDDDPRVFFPQRPKHVKLHKITGILGDYGVGNRGGGLSIILLDGRSVDFAVGSGLTLGNASILPCRIPNYIKPDGSVEINCSDWPKEFILNKTKVLVTYWYQKEYDSITDTNGAVSRDYSHYRVTKVTDQVDLAK